MSTPSFNEKMQEVINSMPDDPLAQRLMLAVYYLAESAAFNAHAETDRDDLLRAVLGCSSAALAAARTRVHAAMASWNALSAARERQE